MQTIGNEMDVMEVCNHVMKDYKFYAGSGGGVTLSGGEPLLQFQFSESILKNLKNNKVHTAVDTAANTPWENFEAIIPYTDLFLVDIKMANKKRHYDHTGDGNERIIKNFNKLWQKAIPVWVRIPLIFGINDLDDEIDQMIELIRNADNVRKIQLLPYHRYGLGKYEMLGIRKEGHEFKTPSDEKVKGILDLFHNAGLTHAECG
jgi:pyruvate formate lyase activating enzyme